MSLERNPYNSGAAPAKIQMSASSDLRPAAISGGCSSSVTSFGASLSDNEGPVKCFRKAYGI